MSSIEIPTKKTTKRSTSKKKTAKKNVIENNIIETENITETTENSNINIEEPVQKVKKVAKRSSKKVSKKKTSTEPIQNISEEHSEDVSSEIKHSPNKFIKMDLNSHKTNQSNKIIIDDKDLNTKVEELNKKMNEYITEISDLKLTVQNLEERLNRILNQLIKPNPNEHLDIITELSSILNNNE